LRGSPKATEQLIDSLDFKHKYTSGVLSFAPNEKVTKEMEQAMYERTLKENAILSRQVESLQNQTTELNRQVTQFVSLYNQ
ncbi:MbeD/MobD family mobilization/exclusion protein, partial [Klebsiella pneumoniae]|uniref:MbeD/MobD family mobilization/exclusion protein n=1 Tax=Klebsiella pneumoniae TaxID=573 RepID=UPI002DBCD4A1